MQTPAVVIDAPKKLSVRSVALAVPGADDVVVDVAYSGVSSGTERLIWSGDMPVFPGFGYPLVPGYESVGEVVDAVPACGLKAGDFVFAPGSNRFTDVRGLFGGAASTLVSNAARLCRIDRALGGEAALLALAATAYHVLATGPAPDLIIGHGTLGRLLARLTVLYGNPPPVVWEQLGSRRDGADGYEVIAPDNDTRSNYASICDVSGDATILDTLIGKLVPGGEITLAGFYADDVRFAFPPAFMKEARLRISAEWKPDDLTGVRGLIEDGALSLGGLVTHRAPVANAADAYRTAFTEPDCLKMILAWKDDQ